MTASHGNPNAGDGVEKSTVDARQAETTGHVRWVLRISLVLGVLALGAVFVGFAVSVHNPSPPAAHATPPAISSGARDAGTS